MARTRKQILVKIYGPKQEELPKFQRKVNEAYADAVSQRLKDLKLDRQAVREILDGVAGKIYQ